MKYEKSKKVFVCCGQYYATTSATADKKIICPRCDNELTTPVRVPTIVIIKS